MLLIILEKNKALISFATNFNDSKNAKIITARIARFKTGAVSNSEKAKFFQYIKTMLVSEKS